MKTFHILTSIFVILFMVILPAGSYMLCFIVDRVKQKLSKEPKPVICAIKEYKEEY